MKQYTVKEYLDALAAQGLVLRESVSGIASAPVSDVTFDSRTVTPGSVFVCKGETFKESYLQSAADKGALCYISESKTIS